MATGNSYKTVSKMFDFGKSTVIKITADFVKELVRSALRFYKISENKLRNCKCNAVIQIIL